MSVSVLFVRATRSRGSERSVADAGGVCRVEAIRYWTGWGSGAWGEEEGEGCGVVCCGICGEDEDADCAGCILGLRGWCGDGVGEWFVDLGDCEGV